MLRTGGHPAFYDACGWPGSTIQKSQGCYSSCHGNAGSATALWVRAKSAFIFSTERLVVVFGSLRQCMGTAAVVALLGSASQVQKPAELSVRGKLELIPDYMHRFGPEHPRFTNISSHHRPYLACGQAFRKCDQDE